MTQVEQVFARPRALAKSPYMLEVRHCTWSIGLSKSHFNACCCAIRVKFMSGNSAFTTKDNYGFQCAEHSF